MADSTGSVVGWMEQTVQCCELDYARQSSAESLRDFLLLPLDSVARESERIQIYAFVWSPEKGQRREVGRTLICIALKESSLETGVMWLGVTARSGQWPVI